MNFGSILNPLTGFTSFFNSSEAQGAAEESAAELDAAKAEQIRENTETELKKIETDTAINKGKKVAQVDANF